ncbi:MAG: hypothetical protein ACK50A_02210 [Sphingobacteriaceae bacterium]|jgi:hypothetical protein
MRDIFLIIIALILFLSCNDQEKIEVHSDQISDSNSFQKDLSSHIDSCGCESTVYLNDPDTNGTNVRDTPNGKVIKKLKYDPDCLCLIVNISSSKNEWVQLKEGGWVYAPLFAVGSRNYGENNKLYLNESPTEESPTTAEYMDEQEFIILGCNGTWLYVKGKDGKKGWLTQNMQCPTPLTTCP